MEGELFPGFLPPRSFFKGVSTRSVDDLVQGDVRHRRRQVSRLCGEMR